MAKKLTQYTPYSFDKTWINENYNLEDFDPERTDYSDRDLEAYTELMLREDYLPRKKEDQGPRILFQEHMENRWNREVLNKNGVPDDEITTNNSPDGQTMYWRFHKEGRKMNSEKNVRDNGASMWR